jgi:uncharacterized protein Yka (UPF0111/DUF47 family)
VPEDGPARIGTVLEELGARFDLVIEAVTGFGGKLQSLRDEIFAQFAEVGGQVRFLSEQIAENRRGIGATKSDLSAEMVRLGEMLGRTRVEIREQMAAAQDGLGKKLDASASAADRLHDEAAAAAEASRGIRREVTASAESTVKRIGAELKQTQKALAALVHKFERFDDRLTIQARDQDQRIRKLERKRSA